MKLALSLIGFLVGVALYTLIMVLTLPVVVNSILISTILIFGILLQLNYGNAKFSRVLVLSAAIAVIFGVTIGKLPDASDFTYNALIYLLLIMSTYIAACYLNSYLVHNRLHFPYKDLFEFSWNSAFILFISSVFCATFWMILFLFGLLIISTIDNILKPKIIGRKIGLHPDIVFLGVIGGLMLFGMLGILLGPLLISFLIIFVRIFKKKEFL